MQRNGIQQDVRVRLRKGQKLHTEAESQERKEEFGNHQEPCKESRFAGVLVFVEIGMRSTPIARHPLGRDEIEHVVDKDQQSAEDEEIVGIVAQRRQVSEPATQPRRSGFIVDQVQQRQHNTLQNEGECRHSHKIFHVHVDHAKLATTRFDRFTFGCNTSFHKTTKLLGKTFETQN